MSLFISFEGLDGSGKSTQCRRLARDLRQRGLSVTETREPGGTPLGERARSLLFNATAPPKTAMSVALLYAAARAQLVADVIRPSLSHGEIVIADRYADSTIAYQAFGQGLDLDDMRHLVRIATGNLRPDITLFVDVPVDVGLTRLSGRHETNWLDTQTRAFHERVQNGYRYLIDQEPARWHCIDGNRPPDAVHYAILGSLKPVLTRVTQAK